MSEHMGSPSRWKKLNAKRLDENDWCRKTFNVKVRKRHKGYAGPIWLSAHDSPGYPMHWYMSIDHAEYLLGQLERALKRAKATSASSSPGAVRKRAVRGDG